MADTDASGKPLSDDELDDLVASSDTGGRAPTGIPMKMLVWLPLTWSLFQLYYASPLPFILTPALGINVTLNDTEARAIHLAFAIFLAFMAFPALKRSPRHYIPIQDWVFAAVGAYCAAYLFIFYEALAERPGLPTTMDKYTAVVGLILLLEATRRALGPPLMVVATVFLAYVFLGDSEFLPDVIRWKGASLDKAMSHMWITTEGVFGIALGVSTSFVFLFVLFGSLLDKAGAGNYFIKVAFSLLGHLKGGPAKAAVVASAMTGLISGSSIANVVTTGTFTIPLMRRVGFSSEKAGAVEVASSVNGQIMPPVMGAAAFLMVEYVGISYVEVVKHAFLPAVISYIALVYIVHLEALKTGMKGLPRPGEVKPAKMALASFGAIVSLFIVVCGIAYYVFGAAEALWDSGQIAIASAVIIAVTAAVAAVIKVAMPESTRGWLLSTGAMVLGFGTVGAFLLFGIVKLIQENAGDSAGLILAIMVLVAYVVLLGFGSRYPDLELDDPKSEVVTLPEPGPTIKAGLHYILPIVVLVWFLMVERKSPGLSAFWASLLMIVILLTQHPLTKLFRGQSEVASAIALGISDLADGLVAGARNMIGIGIATATAGIIVGTVSLTGIGQVMAEFVEVLSLGNVLLMLFWVAILSLILGMGLPTTANYIVVSSLMAPVVVELGADAGLIVPLIAVHMFVFYFGIMADVTPPVGLASFAAAAVSGGDPIKTGFVAFFYSLRTAALPFIFIFNPALIMIGIEGPIHLVLTVTSATIAMLIFAAATQGYFVARSKIYETIALLLIAFVLFRPGFIWDRIYPPYQEVAGTELASALDQASVGLKLPIIVEGENLDADIVQKTFVVPVGEGGGLERLAGAGLELSEGDGGAIIDNVQFGSQADKLGIADLFDGKIVSVQLASDSPPKELAWLPALALLVLIIIMQRRRARAEP